MGVRALGLGGAFVAVADDATASYWNPAGLAVGSFFTISIEHQIHEFPGGDDTPGVLPARRSASTLASVATLPLGVSYYQVTATAAFASGGSAAPDLLRTLHTTHVGVTLLQSLGDYVVVGATLKGVRGSAGATAVGADESFEDAVDRAEASRGPASWRAGLDLGVLVKSEHVRAGLAFRDVSEPHFTAPDGEQLSLKRTGRLGVALLPSDRWTVSVDIDLLEQAPLGDEPRRNLAAGLERWIVPKRLALRGGARGSVIGEARATLAGGASVALGRSWWVDAQVSGGREPADRGWGLSGRFAF